MSIDLAGGLRRPEVDVAGDAYDTLQDRLQRDFVPYSVIWELTHRCNLKCVMCYNEPRAEPELTTTECYAILEQLAAAGALRLIFTGGEILTRPDFFEIAREARRLGFALDLKTNGTLITPETADRIAGLTPLQVDVSLLGASDDTCATVTGGRGALSQVTRGVMLLRERSVRVKLNTLLMDANIGERAQMLDLAFRLGAQYEQALKISPTDSGASRAAEGQLSGGQMAAVLAAGGGKFTTLSRKPDSRTCTAGLASCLISPCGIAHPCVELRVPAGNLRRRSFGEIWRDAPVFIELRASHCIAALPDCRECALLTYCEGRCAGISWKETGDFYRGHTLACRHAQARYEQQHPGTVAPKTPFLAGRTKQTAPHHGLKREDGFPK